MLQNQFCNFSYALFAISVKTNYFFHWLYFAFHFDVMILKYAFFPPVSDALHVIIKSSEKKSDPINSYCFLCGNSWIRLAFNLHINDGISFLLGTHIYRDHWSLLFPLRMNFFQHSFCLNLDIIWHLRHHSISWTKTVKPLLVLVLYFWNEFRDNPVEGNVCGFLFLTTFHVFIFSPPFSSHYLILSKCQTDSISAPP